jgi:hypothetical protein
MADGTKTIKVPRSGAPPEDYEIGGAADFDLIAARAVYDGSGAMGDFLPTLQILNAAGEVMATVFGSPVTAGDSREVTFAPFLRTSEAGTGDGIRFDFPNVGGYLDITVDAPDPGGRGFDLRDANGDGIRIIQTAAAAGSLGLDLENSSDSDTHLRSNGDGLMEIRNTGGEILIQTNNAGLGNHDITIDSRGNVILPNIPNADPGVTGALYFDASGFVKRSP